MNNCCGWRFQLKGGNHSRRRVIGGASCLSLRESPSFLKTVKSLVNYFEEFQLVLNSLGLFSGIPIVERRYIHSQGCVVTDLISMCHPPSLASPQKGIWRG